MSEKSSGPHVPQGPQNKESFKHEDTVQFADGRVGLEFKTPGDVVTWGVHKYADPESSSMDCVIVTTVDSTGKRQRTFALGSGVAVMLPEFDKATARFGKSGDQVHAADLSKIAPHGLPEIVIGEPWSVIQGEDAVASVLMDYTSRAPGDEKIEEQAPFDNPFDSARDHIRRVASLMHP